MSTPDFDALIAELLRPPTPEEKARREEIKARMALLPKCGTCGGHYHSYGPHYCSPNFLVFDVLPEEAEPGTTK